MSKTSKNTEKVFKEIAGVDANSEFNKLTTDFNKLTTERMLTKQTLAKAAKVFSVDENGQFIKPSFLTTMINWKLIIQILLELLIKYLDANKTDKLLWESNKR